MVKNTIIVFREYWSGSYNKFAQIFQLNNELLGRIQIFAYTVYSINHQEPRIDLITLVKGQF